jgi:hypothetical protein
MGKNAEAKMSNPIATVRVCPRCAEEIKSQALACKHCGLDIQKWDLKEKNKEKRAADRKRATFEVARLIDESIFYTVYDTYEKEINHDNINELKGLIIKWPHAQNALEIVCYDNNDERITYDRMIKRAEELGMIYDDSRRIAIREKVRDESAADLKSAQKQTQIMMALIIGFFTIVIVWLIIAAISPKPLSGREKQMELYCNRLGVTCDPDKMKRIFGD